MNTKNMFIRYGLILAPIGICLSCLFLWVFWSPIKDEFTVFQRKQDLSGVESEFNAIFDDLPRSETDTVLAVRTLQPLTIGRGLFSGCITGNKRIVFGTTREFEEVIAEYEVLFKDHQTWRQSSETGYRTKKALFKLYLEEPSSFTYPPECAGFLVCYVADLDYADPSYDSCSG